MDLREALELEIVLHQFAAIHERLNGDIELRAPSHSLFVLSEDLVHDQLNLVEPLFIAELAVFFLELGHVSGHEGILPLIAALDAYPLCGGTAPLMDLWVEFLNVDSVLRHGLLK